MPPQQLTWAWPETPILLAAIVLGAVVIHLVLRRAITIVTNRALKSAEQRRSTGKPKALLGAAAAVRVQQRTATLGSMLRSITAVVVWTIAILTLMSVIGLPLTPLLASAGVGGIALGFGAQSLVKDFLSGVFMMIEDQYGVGDIIDTGEVTGTVEEVSLRVTRLRDASGQVWYVRNGEILRIGNITQGWSTVMVDIPIASDEDPQRAIDVLATAAEEFAADQQWDSVLIDPPSVLGVESVVGGTMTIRLKLTTAPNQQWSPMRALREACLTAVSQAGIRGPLLPLDPRTREP